MRITTAVSSSEFDWFTSCRAIDAMVMFNTPFRGQQELSLLGAEQTTSSLVVMIVKYQSRKKESISSVEERISSSFTPAAFANRTE